MDNTPVQLTRYAHGAGCGCKISPKVLDEILRREDAEPDYPNLLVGNHSRDDAAVYDLGEGRALISTTDFFMPVVDDPYAFGGIAAANAISDIYAMGGTPLLAIAILGWPVNLLPPSIAAKVLEGARSTCKAAGIPLAGGHSIDNPEPVFGLAVNGTVAVRHLKRNNTAKPGNLLLLTKPLGTGILTTAEKKGLLKPEHRDLAAKGMLQLNKAGAALATLDSVTAMTDVTGFGLLGHLTEMAGGSQCAAELYFDKIPLLSPDLPDYIEQQAVPGGTGRNWESYGHKIGALTPLRKAILADPQTSGGLLIAAEAEGLEEIRAVLAAHQLSAFGTPIGKLTAAKDREQPLITVL
ncbi:selenide, water dikinase SelD [Compostibacter hankyongensis]|uniref:Selenide, water dikinase n=1 Tax=Compostibacter hankyongensis TaxID=1007089 RepID=A0ABP8FE27_9BACT